MKNPFPGMNPYLELRWRDVHTRLMVYLCDQLQDGLPADLVARVEESVAVASGEERPSRLSPDVRVVEEPDAGEGGLAVAAAVAIADEPLLVRVDEHVAERHIEIIEPGTGNRVITAIEVLSPTNKVEQDSRTAYRRKQQSYLDARVNLVEIDLIRAGHYVCAAPLAEIPESKRTPYCVSVRRAATPWQAEYYAAPLRQPLPHVSIPLRRSDADIALDLQAAIDLCCLRGRYRAADYRRELLSPLSREDAQWAAERLRAAGVE